MTEMSNKVQERRLKWLHWHVMREEGHYDNYTREGTVVGGSVRPSHIEEYVVLSRPHIKVGQRSNEKEEYTSRNTPYL